MNFQRSSVHFIICFVMKPNLSLSLSLFFCLSYKMHTEMQLFKFLCVWGGYVCPFIGFFETSLWV